MKNGRTTAGLAGKGGEKVSDRGQLVQNTAASGGGEGCEAQQLTIGRLQARAEFHIDNAAAISPW